MLTGRETLVFVSASSHAACDDANWDTACIVKRGDAQSPHFLTSSYVRAEDLSRYQDTKYSLYRCQSCAITKADEIPSRPWLLHAPFMAKFVQINSVRRVTGWGKVTHRGSGRGGYSGEVAGEPKHKGARLYQHFPLFVRSKPTIL
jgi:hypothetical protein